MKNKVLFTYLSELRFYYMRMYYKKELDKYCGTSHKIKDEKAFYEAFIDNSVFDYGSSLNKICSENYYKEDNPVYILAMNLYSYVESVKNAFQIYDAEGNDVSSYQFETPNFEYVRNAVQILKVLMMHFTMRHMDRYPTVKVDDSMFGIPNPNSWDFLPDSIIKDRLDKKQYFTYDIGRIFSYYNSYENIEMFISGKGISTDCLTLFSDKVLKAYIEYLPICNQVSHFEMKESDNSIRVSYNYCSYRGEDGERIYYIDQVFNKMNEFYILSFQRAEEYYFDVYEYRSFTEDPIITALEPNLKLFKKDGRATKKDVYHKIKPIKASIFIQ